MKARNVIGREEIDYRNAETVLGLSALRETNYGKCVNENTLIGQNHGRALNIARIKSYEIFSYEPTLREFRDISPHFHPLIDHFHRTLILVISRLNFYSPYYHSRSAFAHPPALLPPPFFHPFLRSVRKSVKSSSRSISSQSRMPTILLRECFNERGSSDAPAFPFSPASLIFRIFREKSGQTRGRRRDKERGTREKEVEQRRFFQQPRLKG